MTKYYKLKKQWLGGEVTLKADTKVWFEQDSEQWYMCFHEGRIKIVKYVIDEDMLLFYFEEIKEEQPFLWSDALIKEMIYEKLPLPNHYAGNVQKCLNEFKASKQQTNTIPSGEKYKQWDIPMNATIKQSQPKTERRIVTEFRVYNKHPLENSYQFDTSHHIEKEKLPLIKQAIEKIINQ